MRNVQAGHAALLISLIFGFMAAASAHAEPTLMLAGSEDFSGTETVLTLEDLGLANGDDVPAMGGVDLMLSDGNPAKVFLDAFAREFGDQGMTAANNFWGYGFPPPDFVITFPEVVHRMGFMARVNDLDDLSLTFRAAGEVVDQLVVASRGSDQLYFYGFENAAGFDEVVVDAVENASGAFTLDNLMFEVLEVPADEVPQEIPDEVVEEEEVVEEGPPVLACLGFTSPFDALLDDPKHARHAKLLQAMLRWSPALDLRASLEDAEGFAMGDADLMAPPVVQVLFTPPDSEEAVDVTAELTWRDAFRFTRKGEWRMGLKRHRMRKAGSYRITMESGDESEYAIDPTCEQTVVKEVRRRSFQRARRR